MSQLVKLIGSVAATSNPQPVFIELTNGTPATAAVFKGTTWGYAIWSADYGSGCNWCVSDSGGGTFLGIESNEGEVSGTITLNVAMDVPVELSLINQYGKTIGKDELAAGSTSVSFTFTVAQGDGYAPMELVSEIQSFLNATG